MEAAVIAGVYIGLPRELPGEKRAWTSSFGRRPAAGRIAVEVGGVAGDGVFDHVAHGGPDRVLLAYAAEHYDRWREELSGCAFLAPAFGENLLVAGLDETSVCVGDVWAVGGARLQVSMPRWPCGKIALYNGVPDLLGRVLASGRAGWLLRVLAPGEIGAGDHVTLLERPHADWPIARAFAVYRALKGADRGALDDACALAGVTALAAGWRKAIDKKLATFA